MGSCVEGGGGPECAKAHIFLRGGGDGDSLRTSISQEEKQEEKPLKLHASWDRGSLPTPQRVPEGSTPPPVWL